jgi:hypothetical protein
MDPIELHVLLKHSKSVYFGFALLFKHLILVLFRLFNKFYAFLNNASDP